MYFVPFRSQLPILMCTFSATDPPGVYKVITTSLAHSLPPGTVFRVNTGAPIPPGADAVIMVEDTLVKSTHKSKEGGDLEEAEIQTLAQIPKGENIRSPGSDIKKGDLVLSKHTILDGLGGDVGTLAFVGKMEVHAFPPIPYLHLRRDHATGPCHSKTRCRDPEHRKRNCRFAWRPKDLERVLGRYMGYQSPLVTNLPRDSWLSCSRPGHRP